MSRTVLGYAIALIAALILTLWPVAEAQALTQPQAVAIASGDSDDRVKALQDAVATGDTALAPFIQALLDDTVKVAAGKAFIARDDKVLDAVTLQPAALPEGAEDVVNNNRMRREFGEAQQLLRLLSPQAQARQKVLKEMASQADADTLSLIDKAAALAKDAGAKADLTQFKAEAQARVKRNAELAVWGERAGILFTGASLGSVLLLAALGLAITYGLMGVINMAHGELIMIGAYATYLVQNLFRQHLPGAFDYYILAAIPVAFLASALVGAVLERLVIRHLYGRPLETLLATWGISLMLMQAVRSLFGAQNVAVENPPWLSGGWQVLPNLTLPYNRIGILVFAALVCIALALLIARTRLGLFVRGVTQNRRMAACTGVNTARVDMMAFALGAGIAGLAGCALSQMGNVGPDLGQGYIVDSFMVVVLGGVGQLAGTVVAALGLGLANKLLEAQAGAVLAKIAVLVFIIVFIQKRPQGLFAMRGRSAEA